MSSSNISTPGIFLSHSHADKAFARKLAKDLIDAGARVWIDEAELQIGDSLIEKIREGIDNMEYLAVILSPESVHSRWVQKEVDIAMNLQIQGRGIKVLPLMYRYCEMPGFLLGMFYGDFTNPHTYDTALRQVLKRLGLSHVQPLPTITTPHPSFQELSTDARLLLLQAAMDETQTISTHLEVISSVPVLYSLKTGNLERVMDDENERRRWAVALELLNERGFIKHVASRPGYRAYQLTPAGWEVAEFARQFLQ
jgi:hypothetical protein